MRVKDFKKLTKEKAPIEIIYMYTMWKIKLTNKQLDWLLARSRKGE